MNTSDYIIRKASVHHEKLSILFMLSIVGLFMIVILGATSLLTYVIGGLLR